MPIAVASGRIASKLGHRPLSVPGGLIFAAAGLWQWSGLTAHPAYLSQWLAATVLTGIGVGLSISPLASAAAHGLPATRYAIGGAFNSAVRQVGTVLGVALSFALLGVRSQNAAVMDFKRVFVLMIACGAVTSLFAAGIATRPDPSRE
jgi:MFS family permease